VRPPPHPCVRVEKTIDKAVAPRKWWLAGLLSLITPGLGQIYNGQIYKAIIFFFGPLLFIPPAIYILLYGFTSGFTRTITIALSVTFLIVAIAADASKARRTVPLIPSIDLIRAFIFGVALDSTRW
jgi:TM2 domain-containing membrane protein YozV